MSPDLGRHFQVAHRHSSQMLSSQAATTHSVMERHILGRRQGVLPEAAVARYNVDRPPSTQTSCPVT